MLSVLTDSEVDQIATRVCNWGRWGDTDQIGTLNLISDTSRQRAAALVHTGEAVSLSRAIDLGPHGGVRAPVHTVWKTSSTAAETAGDFIGMAYHGPSVTHLDALNHIHRGNVMYNGFDAEDFTPLGGYSQLAVDQIASKLCGRGVLLDLPKAGVVPDVLGDRPEYGIAHLEQCIDALGVTIEEGDVLFVRFGHNPVDHEAPTPGLAPETALWLHEVGVAALGSDGPSDAMPPREGRWKVPIHQLTIHSMGMPLLDNCHLDVLATAADRAGRYEFFLAVGALPIKGGTGSPCNPLAVL